MAQLPEGYLWDKDLSTHGAAQLLSADGATLIGDKDMILESWAGHFHSILKRPRTSTVVATGHLPQELVTYKDVAVDFTQEQWSFLDHPQELYKEVMLENAQNLLSLASCQRRFDLLF
uniref:Zinc finger protein 215-like isoform X2 n=1 Tax=Phascolarctos cinereus TaxID=38626 RepID=A0A6P5JNZ1_PHACI|nr:zinc finger protein 215-like isoform X2 [Phascolarctos cinereus]